MAIGHGTTRHDGDLAKQLADKTAECDHLTKENAALRAHPAVIANPGLDTEAKKLKAEAEKSKEEIARLTNENKALHAKWDAVVKAMAAADPELGDNKRLKDEVAHLRKRAGI